MDMKEYRVVWCQCPHVQHTTKVLFVRAPSEEDARKIARDHIERQFAITWFTFPEVSEAKPVPPGEVL